MLVSQLQFGQGQIYICTVVAKFSLCPPNLWISSRFVFLICFCYCYFFLKICQFYNCSLAKGTDIFAPWWQNSLSYEIGFQINATRMLEHFWDIFISGKLNNCILIWYLFDAWIGAKIGNSAHSLDFDHMQCTSNMFNITLNSSIWNPSNKNIMNPKRCSGLMMTHTEIWNALKKNPVVLTSEDLK